MATPAQPHPLLASKGLLVPLLLIVLLILLYVAGVPWVVVALDGFWEGVDRLAEHPRILSFLTALSSAVAAFFVYRFYRLSLWNKRVSSALEAVTAPSVARQELGWRSLSHLATAEGLPKDERAWLTAVLDDLHGQGDRQLPTSPACERCGRG
ncbi:hypothetical protein AVL61_04985 [Kocuria rosea subsp. polaris]|uniref:Uncharacterized protein n=1 Tax=Kocuria rosea subsp. polaris TaxID=136273 RepID=A0A0W8I883_KOCRO|nr:hypothetical protein [Kocuria polaris]KUG55490.1 hypothetical protein AVL61_04985 [Kocuria polaris]